MGLVFLHLLDGALVLRQIVDGAEALENLSLQVPVGHRVADHPDSPAVLPQRASQMAETSKKQMPSTSAQCETMNDTGSLIAASSFSTPALMPD